MKTLRSSILLTLGIAASLANGQKNTKKPQPGPVETTVCNVLGDPSAYNNRLVKVRGYASASSEYSLLVDERCDTDPMWLAFADGSAPPPLEVIVNGTGTAGGRDSKGRQIAPIPVHLIRDANYGQLMHYLALRQKARLALMGLLSHSRLTVLPIVSPLRLRAVLMASPSRFTKPTVNDPVATKSTGRGSDI